MAPAMESPACLAVAYSGGRDSTALLHAVCRAAMGSDIAVHALHVHHGLSPNADHWQQHCEEQCRRWGRRGYPVQCHVAAVTVETAPGISVEAEARTQRYAALARMARSLHCQTVLLAHHREDQAETVLLQALRGAGVAGLAAMPSEVVRQGVRWVRPWLGQPRAAIEAYVRRYRLRYVDDDSNADPRWDRNRLRLSVWPALLEAFPQAAQALSNVARQAQDARVSVADLAEQDAALAVAQGALVLPAWRALPAARQRHVLMAWLRSATGMSADRALIDRLIAELPKASVGHWPMGTGWLRLYRSRLTWHAQSDVVGTARLTVIALAIGAPGLYDIPAWHGALRVEVVETGGVAPSAAASLELRPRQGGERFQRAAGTPARSLKKQFQAADIPEWDRHGPLIWAGGQLLFVPGLGIDARCAASPGSPQWGLQWQPWTVR